MAVTLKVLASVSSLTAGTGGATFDLSPTGSSTKGWLIKNIFFFNTTPGQTMTFELKIKQGTTYRTISKTTSLPSGTSTPVFLERDITLDLNRPDVLSVHLTSTPGTGAAQCVINGIQRDQ